MSQPKPKHTPGPWSYDGTGALLGDKRSIHLADLKTSHADARLIAAAPELLEYSKALSAAIAKLDSTMPYECRVELIGQLRDLRAAIAKAEGR